MREPLLMSEVQPWVMMLDAPVRSAAVHGVVVQRSVDRV